MRRMTAAVRVSEFAGFTAAFGIPGAAPRDLLTEGDTG
jgi:glyoxylate carboligase